MGRGCQLVGVHVVRVSRIRFAKIETAKISSEESGGIYAKFCTSENFPLYGTPIGENLGVIVHT